MLDFTPIARQFFAHRLQEIKRFTEYSESVQRDVLATLLGCASYTEYGQKYRFPSIRGYNDFSHTLPLTTYEDLKPHIQRMIRGEKSILWPGRVDKFAQSSGTSDGKSKYIPITNDALKKNHYQGASDVVALYLNMNPDSHIFSGKAFILGGSFEFVLPDACCRCFIFIPTGMKMKSSVRYRMCFAKVRVQILHER